MTEFRKKLLFALIILIISLLIGVGFLLGKLYKEYYRQTFDGRMMKEVNLVASYITINGGITQINPNRYKYFSDSLNARITIVNENGHIYFDSGKLSDISEEQHKDIISGILTKRYKDQEDFTIEGNKKLHYYWKKINDPSNKDGYLFISTTLTEIKDAYRQIWWILSISLSFALMVIILLGMKISKRYIQPIESAANVAMELAKGNYRARVSEQDIDETGMLSASLNILARNFEQVVKEHEMQRDRLGTLIENIGSGLILIDSRGYISLMNRAYKETFNVKVEDFVYKRYYEVIEQDEISKLIEMIFITEQKVKKQIVLPLSIVKRHFEVYGVPIIGTNDVWRGILLVFHDITEIKKLEQMRKDFVANVSHELKTPITSIKGFSETLLDGAMNDQETTKAFLNIILKESDRLQSLIEDLLDLSKIEQQGFTLSIQRVNIVSVVEEVLTILNGKAGSKDIELDFQIPQREIFMEIDVSRMKQVFINLITNAILYTSNGGKVSVKVIDQMSKIIIQIKDTGIGIEKDEIPRIFERFYRIDKARSRDSGGTGLGLAIVKHIVEAHKGQVKVESEIGVGTTFTIELHKYFPRM